MNCKKCGVVLLANPNFCPNCGAPQIEFTVSEITEMCQIREKITDHETWFEAVCNNQIIYKSVVLKFGYDDIRRSTMLSELFSCFLDGKADLEKRRNAEVEARLSFINNLLLDGWQIITTDKRGNPVLMQRKVLEQ